jgi:hypothetical protein
MAFLGALEQDGDESLKTCFCKLPAGSDSQLDSKNISANIRSGVNCVGDSLQARDLFLEAKRMLKLYCFLQDCSMVSLPLTSMAGNLLFTDI